MTETPSAWPEQDWTRPARPSWWVPGATATFFTAPVLALSLLFTVIGVVAQTLLKDELSEDLPPDVIVEESRLSDVAGWVFVTMGPILISITLTTAAWLTGRRHLGLAWCLALLAIAAAAFPFWPMEWGGRAEYGDG